jgi:hypothetical protein
VRVTESWNLQEPTPFISVVQLGCLLGARERLMPGVDVVYDREHGIGTMADRIFRNIIEPEQPQEIREGGW